MPLAISPNRRPVRPLAAAILPLIGLLLSGIDARTQGGPVEQVLDPMEATRGWRLGGDRIAYSLGTSALQIAAALPREGAERYILLSADFTDPARSMVSAVRLEPTGAFDCRSIGLWALGDGSGSELRITIEDAEGRFFEAAAASLDFTTWRRVDIPITDNPAWKPLVRTGESPSPIRQPVAVRRILLAPPEDRSKLQASGGIARVGLSGLAAQIEPNPLDAIMGKVVPTQPAGIFVQGQKAELRLILRNKGSSAMTGRCSARLIDMDGRTIAADLGIAAIPAGGHRSLSYVPMVKRFGPYTVRFRFEVAGRSREWIGRFGLLRGTEPLRRRSDARLGSNGAVYGLPTAADRTLRSLNRLGGIGVTRIGLSWEQVNPAPGVWVWDRPAMIPGPSGHGMRTGQKALQANDGARLNATDEVTIAFWARTPGGDAGRQNIVSKGAYGGPRNYSVFLRAQSGRFAFSASSEKDPGSAVEFDARVDGRDGRWRHYAVTYSRHIRQVALYVDGAVRTTAVFDGGRLLTNGSPLVIGDANPLDIDELVLYQRALGPADIAALARKARPPADGLLARWSFDGPDPLSGRVGRGDLRLTAVEPLGITAARQARAQRIEPLLILGFPPEWASSWTPGSAGQRPWLHQPDLKAWAAYVENVVRRYRDIVQCWEIWNEPDSPAFWEPAPDPVRYGALLKTAFVAAKRGNPRAIVVMPGVAGSGPRPDFLDALLQKGYGRWCDAISIHHYSPLAPETELARRLRHIKELCSAAHLARPIWITELSRSVQTPDGVTERVQASLLARSCIVALSEGPVEKILWFRLNDPGADPFDLEDGYGLCRDDLSPRAAFFAFRTLAVLLGRARSLGAAAPGRGIEVRTFRSAGERLAAIWSRTGPQWVGVQAHKARIQTTDLMGNSVLQSASEGTLLLRVDDAPTFVRYLPDEVRWIGALLTVSGRIDAQEGRILIEARVTNPYRTSIECPVTVRIGIDQTAEAHGTLTVKPGATKQIRLTLPLPRDDGSIRLHCRAQMRGRTIDAACELARP